MTPRLGLAALCAAATCTAADPALRFDPPEVLKLDWNTRCPRSADFNGDGRPDLAVLNLDRARIEFLLQGEHGPIDAPPEKRANRDRWNPVLEWSRFDKQPLVVGQAMYALAAGDFNGDARADVAYTTDDGHLIWRFQGTTPGDWSGKREYTLDSVSGESDSLLTADLNADGRPDLALLTQTRLLVWLQGPKGRWPDPQEYALSDKAAMMLQAADLNGDGRTDLFTTSGDTTQLLARLQTPDATFGEEWAIEVPQPGTWLQPLRLGDQTGLTWLQENTGMIQVARLIDLPDATRAEHAASLRHAIPPSDARTGASAFGDLTGDTFGDVVIADPKGARVWLFAGLPDGSFATAREFPALSGVESLVISDADGDGQPDLLLLSPSEKLIGLSRWRKDRLDYPETVHQSTDTLTALTAGEFRGSSCVLGLEEKKPQPALTVLRWQAASQTWNTERLDLPGAPTKVNALRLHDADRDGRNDLLLFSTLSPMQIRLDRADADDPLPKATGLPDSLTSKLTPGALTTGDVDADGKPELIAAKDQIARAFLVEADGKARIVEQFNAPSATARLSAAHVTRRGTDTLVLLADSQDGRLHELHRGKDGVFRARHTRLIGPVPLDETRLITTAEGTRLLGLGRDRFEIVPLEGRSRSLDVLRAFASELKDTTPTDLLPAAFSGGPTDDLLSIDAGKSRVLEFYHAQPTPAPDWQSQLYFRVFQEDPHYRGKKGYDFEPHDYITLDINRDSRLDLCLLVHDRLLLYVATPPPSAAPVKPQAKGKAKAKAKAAP